MSDPSTPTGSNLIRPDNWDTLTPLQKKDARERGIRAQAFGEGRKAERRDVEALFGGVAIEHVLKRPFLQEAHEGEINRRTLEQDRWIRHALWQGRWQGAFIASAATAILVSMAIFTLITLTRADTVAAQRAVAGRQEAPFSDQGYNPQPYAHAPREPRDAP